MSGDINPFTSIKKDVFPVMYAYITTYYYNEGYTQCNYPLCCDHLSSCFCLLSVF
uniref:Uncharacterized protein n=1 Tax=Lepeophtheirus salmonis TaxID=72036 RepID=A0A0K2UZK6_LEPSM